MSIAMPVVITPIPSPYQVELFDTLPAVGITPRVVYVERTHRDRQWEVPQPRHEHLFLEDGDDFLDKAKRWVDDADLVVVSWYADWRCRWLMQHRAATGRPWCFWGERPGFGRSGVLGRLRRWFRLAPLRRSQAPIWGIGNWAVDGWRAEFGNQRHYRNVPYFSDLARFAPKRERARDPRIRRFLFSGSLIKRKGVDRLAEAFAQVANARAGVQLDFVGAGPLESELRTRLKQFEGRVQFHGFTQWNDLPGRYHEADVLVVPSLYDGWGLVVPEGLAAGLPVLSTDRTGAALDLLTPGINGWRVRAGDLNELTDAMNIAADLPEGKLLEMSAAARTSVARHQLADGAERWATAFAEIGKI